MHITLEIMQKLMVFVKQLNALTIKISDELSMEELVKLAELNEEFNKTATEISFNVLEASEKLHKYILSRGLEPRKSNGKDRRINGSDRRKY